MTDVGETDPSGSPTAAIPVTEIVCKEAERSIRIFLDKTTRLRYTGEDDDDGELVERVYRIFHDMLDTLDGLGERSLYLRMRELKLKPGNTLRTQVQHCLDIHTMHAMIFTDITRANREEPTGDKDLFNLFVVACLLVDELDLHFSEEHSVVIERFLKALNKVNHLGTITWCELFTIGTSDIDRTQICLSVRRSYDADPSIVQLHVDALAKVDWIPDETNQEPNPRCLLLTPRKTLGLAMQRLMQALLELNDRYNDARCEDLLSIESPTSETDDDTRVEEFIDENWNGDDSDAESEDFGEDDLEETEEDGLQEVEEDDSDNVKDNPREVEQDS